MREGVPGTDTRPTVAIVGAGVSGLSCARELLGRNVKVKLFDKSRGVGGRLTTRYADAYEFDHGAQYFTVTDADFEALVREAEAAGVVAPWEGRALYLTDDSVDMDRGKARFVGTPRMNSFGKWLADGLPIETGRRVSEMAREGGWRLGFEDGSSEAGFSAVVLTPPVPQTMALIPDGFAHIDTLRTAKMDACFSLMVGMEQPLEHDIISLRAKGLPVDWIAVNSSKPGRPDGVTTLMIHSEPDWSNAHVEADRDYIAEVMLRTASDLLFTDLSDAPHKVLHRWLYSSVANPAGELAFCDAEMRLAVCGDWCPGGRVEGAWLSGREAARQIAEVLG